MNRPVFGSIETVSLPSLQLDSVVAKVDTGAWSGALHCTEIYQKNGALHYRPLGDPHREINTTNYKYRQVRSANGHVEDRFIIPIEVTIRGKNYQTDVGLSDRSEMQREMLLGRKFLIENEILVDVLLTLEDDQEAEKFLWK